MTDIVTPYTIAVMRELAELVDLGVVFAAATSARGAGWSFGELPFPHVVVDGAAVRRADPDVTDYYFNPRILLALLRWRPTVVIAAGWSFPTWYAALYCRLTGAALVIHSDGTPFTERSLSRTQRLSRRLLTPLAAAFAANSTQAARRFLELGAPPQALHSVPHSTELAPFWESAERRTDPGGERLRVLMAGRLVARKGFHEALAAFAQAQAMQPGISLKIAGSGPEERRLRQQADRLGASAVEFVGFVEQPQLAALCAGADAFVLPSLQDEFGFVLLEAQAAGLACIASPFAGATEDLVVDRRTGLIVDPHDHVRLAAALALLAREPGLRRSLGQAAHEASLKRSPAHTAAAYLAAARAAGRSRTGARRLPSPAIQ